LATAQLEAGEAKEALVAALQAREKFSSAGQEDSEWRALLVAALAAKRLGDNAATQAHATLASQTLDNLQRSLDATDAANYRAREDLRYALSQLSNLLNAPA
jgi:hypothetical protein